MVYQHIIVDNGYNIYIILWLVSLLQLLLLFLLLLFLSKKFVDRNTMDYSYLNQAAAAAAAGFEASSCALAASEMQCGYGDLSSCSQMSQAAYRYTAARAAGYPGNAGTTGTGNGPSLGSHHSAHSHAHAHHTTHATPCSVMAVRTQEAHRHAASIFPSAINLQGRYSSNTYTQPNTHTRRCRYKFIQFLLCIHTNWLFIRINSHLYHLNEY